MLWTGLKQIELMACVSVDEFYVGGANEKYWPDTWNSSLMD